MGDRAHYIVRSGDRPELYYSHWGSVRLDVDLLWGPEYAVALARAQLPTEEWLDHVWCEGAALIDVNTKRLLWFGGDDMMVDEMERAVHARMLAVAWDGWTVEWANDGLNDIVDALGLDRSLVDTEIPIRAAPKDWGDSVVDPSWAVTIVSIQGNGRQRVALSSHMPETVIRRGLNVASDQAIWRDRVRLGAVPYGGVHVDLDAKEFAYWTAQPMPVPIHSGPTDADGWSFTRWRAEGLRQHLDRLSDIETVWPTTGQVLDRVCARAMEQGDKDPVASVESLVGRMRSELGKTIEVGPLTSAHVHVPISRADRLAWLDRIRHAVSSHET
ncbi:MAG TPA: hypothetical protein DCR14_06830 [Acidimicrobiaceae bacterium]|nr:hypothetical protein [Acidimicrobiaceae bacterium]